jgi:type IV pilus assembly protein PilY1
MKHSKQTVLLGTGIFVAAVHLNVQAAISLSEVPLFLSVNVAPNVILTLDDSGSMERGYAPDSIGESSTKLNGPRFTAASYNGLYYNPKVTYPIPQRTDGVTYTTSFTNAYINGFNTNKGTINLSATGYRPITRCDPNDSYTSSSCSKATGSGTITSSTTTTYTYNNCQVQFENITSGKNRNDRLYVSNCNMPYSGTGSPGEADDGQITISNAGSYSGTYPVSSSQKNGNTTQINLGSSTQITSNATRNNVNFSWNVTTTTTSTSAAYYHLYYTDKPGAAKPTGCNNTVEDHDCYILIQVGSADDITPGTPAQQKQNFANWYSFYRTRALATMSAAMNAVSSLGTNQVRLGWQTLNNGNCNNFGTSCEGYDGTKRENRIRTLDELKRKSDGSLASPQISHRTDFYNWLQRMTVEGGTPLRSALKRSGEYFKKTGKDSPYAEEPYVTQGTELSCRKNFNIIFTDGYWNGDGNSIDVGNADSTTTTLGDDTTVYTPRYPYRNPSTNPPAGLSYSNSLADQAFYYWATDLRPDDTKMPDNVAPYIVDRSGSATDQYWNPKNDPATWQHMVNFTISLGLSSSITDPEWGGSTYAGDYANLESGAKRWPAIDPSPELSDAPEEHVYDLWHAAINSRGQFFSADNPSAMNAAFQSVFDSILAANPSAAALAANSTSIQSGTLVYQARFDSSDWHGQLIAYSVQTNGNIGNAQWDAATTIPGHTARNIFTWNGTAGRPFKNCNTDLNSSQQTALNKDGYGVVDNRCADRLAWLRGDPANEIRNYVASEVPNKKTFRNRLKSVLGDIINSDPVYVKNEDYGYAATNSALSEGASYASFVASKVNRTPMIYVGANDGMMHAIRADVGATNSGQEIFAYIPAAVYDKLSQLTETGYNHTYYVDGPPSAGDAYINGSWRTVVVGGLGAGGKSIYALDVTNPETFSATNVLWEFSDATDLGHTFSQPKIARLNNGQWAAIFGNGYNSAADRAYLYIVNLSTGTLISKIAAGTATGNGLSTPALYDSNGDKIIDTVYAGDLQGNMWKFDLSSAADTGWVVGNGGVPLFTAKNQNGQVQPITTEPEIMTLTSGIPTGGVMLYFGTGRYLTSTDPTNTEVQTFYAVRDYAGGTATRSDLQVQTINSETTKLGLDVRETSGNTVDWATKKGWYMDLVVSPKTGTGPGGERVISRALVRYDRVIFVTVIPSTDPCVPGGSSWIMELDLLSGGRTVLSAFDFNGDNNFDDNDKLASGNNASGVKSKVGITKTPTWLEEEGSTGKAIKELSGTSGGIMSLGNRKPPKLTSGIIKRIFWEQIQ